jgi:hypothetical protein
VGTDTANVDTGDIVANCETVNRSVVDGDVVDGPGGEILSTFSVLRGQRLFAALARGLRIRAGCRGPCRISGAYLVNSGLLARSVSVAKGSKRLTRAGRATVVLRFTPKAKRKLRRYRRVSGTVRLRVSPPTGGAATTRRKRVTLRR